MKVSLPRFVITISYLVLISQSVNGQLLNNPESIVYDPLRSCHYVSNWGDGRIIKIDSLGVQSVFNENLTRVAGLLLVNDTLYAAANDTPYVGVTGFNPESGAMILYAPMEGADLPNDLVFDGAGSMYCTDYWGHRIYRIDIPMQTAWVYIEYIAGPNGIIYDHINDRLIVTKWVSETNAMCRLMTINLHDSTLALAANPSLGGLDGLAMDSRGRLYFSSWQTDAIYRYDSDLTNPPVEFSSGHDEPADISLNPAETVLAVPNFYWNTIDFVAIPADNAERHGQLLDYQVYPCYPNPFNSETTLKFSLNNSMPLNITAYDIVGREIAELLDGRMEAGVHQLKINADTWSSGSYFLHINANNHQSLSRITLLR
jgi:hypothetical protein